jgi:hypothetical protein
MDARMREGVAVLVLWRRAGGRRIEGDREVVF